MHGLTTIIKESGFKGIYKGCSATIGKSGSNQAVRFFVFGEVYSMFTKYSPLPMTLNIMASAEIAGATSSGAN